MINKKKIAKILQKKKNCDNILAISPIPHPLWNLIFLLIKHQISSDSFYFMSGCTAHWSSPIWPVFVTLNLVFMKIWTDNWKKVAWVRLAAFLLTAIHYPATITLEIRLFHYHQMLHNLLKFRFWVPGSCTFLYRRADRMQFLDKQLWSKLSPDFETIHSEDSVLISHGVWTVRTSSHGILYQSLADWETILNWLSAYFTLLQSQLDNLDWCGELL